MDPLNDEQIDFGDEEYGSSQKMKYHQSGAIPALADEEMIGEEDEYDDLYNDVNVGEGFMQMQQAEAQMPSSGVGNGGIQASKDNVPGTRVESMASQETNKARVANEDRFAPSGIHHPEQNPGWPSTGGHAPKVDASQSGKLSEMTANSQAGNFGYPGSVRPQSADTVIRPEKAVNDPVPLPNQNMGSTKITPQIPPNMVNPNPNPNPNPNANMNRSMNDDYQIRPGVENGNNMLFVGELHWWTTDAELECALIQYGRVKEIKFFDERASGKSKGYCQVEFYDPASAAACKESMDGHIFNGRACVVTFATSQSIKQMGASYNRNQSQVQPQQQGRNTMNDGGGRGNGTNYAGGDGGRNFGRGGWGRNGNQFSNRGPAAGPMRGRGGMGNRNMMGNAPGGGGGAFGQGLANPGFGGTPGMMHPQGGMMGPGFDLAYMGRGAGYGGFPGPSFPGMMPPFPAMNSMGLPGVAPHVNPAFFGRGMTPNGMGMMGTTGMDRPHSGMWNDPSMGGWGGEEHGRGAKESSYGSEDSGSEDGNGEGSHNKGVVRSSKGEKERNSEREWSGNPEKKHREERHDGDRYERDQRYKEDKDRNRDYRHKERDTDYDDDYDRGQSSKPRSRSRAVPEDNHGSRSKDAEYGKRRRMPS